MTLSTLLKRGTAVALVLTVSLAMAGAAGAGSKPLNAGKDGLKSNAGAGNGAEAGAIIEQVEGTLILSTSDPYLIQDPNDPGTTTELTAPEGSVTEINRVKVGDPYYQVPSNTNSALKQNYEVTYEVTTWTGEAWVTTYQTLYVVDVEKQDTLTTTYEDADPGNSQAHNESPEDETVVETENVGEEYTETEATGETGDPVEVQTGEFVSETHEETETISHPCEGGNVANC
jgi:hypothetical protein